jgi:preprotein translocase subunit YajC
MNLLFIDGEVVEGTAPVVENVEGVEAPAADQPMLIEETTVETPVADAAAGSQPEGSSWSFWIMIIAMITIMYFFMWRPESKRRKQMEEFRKGLKKGDKIITAGGIYGTIKEVHDNVLLIEVDSNVTLRIDKSMVAAAPVQQ